MIQHKYSSLKWPLRALVSAVCGSFLLAGCSTPAPNADNGSFNSAEEKTTSQNSGPATPVASPSNQTGGEQITLPGISAPVQQLFAAGDQLAVVTKAEIIVGTLTELQQGQGKTIALPAQCGAATLQHEQITFACAEAQNTVYSVALAAPELRQVLSTTEPVSAAAVLKNGEVITAAADSKDTVLWRQQSEAERWDFNQGVDQLVVSPNADEEGNDGVVVLNRGASTIQQVDYQGGQVGAKLRAGSGVGPAVAGTDGVVFASDTAGNQLLVYTTAPVVRLHQAYPVDQSPWALAYDETRKLVWVSSTATNTVTGYDIASGEPVAKANFTSAANLNSLVALPDGQLVSSSTDQQQLTIYPADSIKQVP